MHTLRRYAVIFGASCTLLLAVGCKKKAPETTDDITVQDDGDGIVFRDGFMEQTLAGNTQGQRDASEFGEDCVGFLPEEPTAEISFREDVPMRIHVVADDDLVLAIAHGDTYYCNDDFDGHQPSLARVWEEGEYEVFIGTKDPEADAAIYELNFDHYDPDRPLEPTPRADEEEEDEDRANFELPLLEDASSLRKLARGTLNVPSDANPHFDAMPYVTNGIAHKDFDLEETDLDARSDVLDAEQCAVKIDRDTPDVVINMLAEGDLHAAVQSDANIGLVVASKSDRVYCSAPSSAKDPAVLRFENLEEGPYAVYLGEVDEALVAAQAGEENDAEDDTDTDADEDAAAAEDKDTSDAEQDADDADEEDDADEDAPLKGRLHLY